uniref:Uncharacterized protein n=1 Tax=Anguilla anguilla TaxID=7936 RepID=A0A0E9XRU7_ANGAN
MEEGNLNRHDTDETQEGTMNNQATEREGKTSQPKNNRIIENNNTIKRGKGTELKT